LAGSCAWTCCAHSKLTKPTPRDGISTGRAGLDENNPVSFEPGCTKENTCDAFVCREASPNPSVPVTTAVAGGSLQLAWHLTALHVGDCSVYISYDVEEQRSQQKYVKIANIPDCKSYTTWTIDLPASLPAGRAILRWDWVALHIWPKTENFVQCADLEIQSTSSMVASQLDSFSITNPPIYPDDGNDGVGFRNPWGPGAEDMTGTSCIDNSINQCQLTAPGTLRNTDSRRGFSGPPGAAPVQSTPAPVAQPQPTPAPSSQPTAAPVTPRCVPVGDCGSRDWCDQDKYMVWCSSQVAICPAPFCKRESSAAAPTPSTVAAPAPGTPVAGGSCVATLETYYTDASVWVPYCTSMGSSYSVCPAPMCRTVASLATSRRHRFRGGIGAALLQTGAEVELGLGSPSLWQDEL